MKRSDKTTPIQNILNQSPSDPRNNQYVLEFISLRPDGMSSVQLNKAKLGKQKYCVTIGFIRCFVWEGKNWRAYVSKRGLSFEVLSASSIDEAWLAWQEYSKKIILGDAMKNKIIRATILGMCTDAYNSKGVFATSDLEYHKVCEKLIHEGCLLETTALHMSEGAADRCFNLTIKGLKELGLIK